jgi:dipeptidyl-peptidase 4
MSRQQHIQDPTLSSEDVARGVPGEIVPSCVQFSPDGAILTFLFPDALGVRQLFYIDTRVLKAGGETEMKQLIDFSQGEEKLSLAEELRRERMRVFSSGLVTYEWSTNGRLLIPKGGSLYIANVNTAEGSVAVELMLLYSGSPIDPHFSPNGQHVAFVEGRDLYTIEIPLSESVASVAIKRTNSEAAAPGVSYGVADYIAQEEMDRYRGFWWSPDSKKIVFTEVDESLIPEYHILHQGKDDPKHSETHRYPFAGDVNPSVKLHVIHLESGNIVSMKIEEPEWTDPEYYIARVGWWPDGSVMVQIENREQKILELLRLNCENGDRSVLERESSEIWINLHDILSHVTVTPEGFGFIWGSERSGFMQLYHYYVSTATGTCDLIGSVTQGDWVVLGIDAVHEGTDGTFEVYFTANANDFLSENLFSVVGGSSEIIQLTNTPGCHQCIVSATDQIVVDVCSSVSHPSVMSVYILTGPSFGQPKFVLDGSIYCSRYFAIKDRISPPVFDSFTVPSINGGPEDTLYCCVYQPDPSIYGAGPYPTIVSVYGGPHVQMVMDRWRLSGDMRSQRMREKGYLVLKCDNRGSFRRGIAFEGVIKHNMGCIEVKDQQALVQRYVDKALADPSRVGIFGWSYGGYMSAMALCRAPETFHCAIAGSS